MFDMGRRLKIMWCGLDSKKIYRCSDYQLCPLVLNSTNFVVLRVPNRKRRIYIVAFSEVNLGIYARFDRFPSCLWWGITLTLLCVSKYWLIFLVKMHKLFLCFGRIPRMWNLCLKLDIIYRYNLPMLDLLNLKFLSVKCISIIYVRVMYPSPYTAGP